MIDKLHVCQILGIPLTADREHRVTQSTDEQSEHGSAKGDHQTAPHQVDVCLRQTQQRGTQRNQGSHQAEHRPDTHAEVHRGQPAGGLDLQVGDKFAAEDALAEMSAAASCEVADEAGIQGGVKERGSD